MAVELPTVVERPGNTATGSTPTPESVSGPRSAGLPTRTTPAEALRSEEVERTRRFLLVILGMTLIGGPLVPLLGGDDLLRNAVLGTLATTAVVLTGFLVFIRDPARYTPYRALVPILTCVAAATAACLYVGIFSAALALFPFGIYFFSLGSSFPATVLTYAVCALLTGGAMILHIAGLLPDRGLIPAGHLAPLDRAVVATVLQSLLAATFWFGRLSRRATVDAFDKLDRARRQVNQREALLEEANRDLDRALQAGYGGRLTGELLGPWRLGDVIGRGAMGEVYRAERGEGDEPVAVKVLERAAAGDPVQLRRFLREAEILSRLESPHVVRVLGAGHTAPGPPWIAMELLEGNDLAWHLRKRRRLPTQAAVDLVAQVAEALEPARAADIVHRDLKPQNVFGIEIGDGRIHWKVLDFGVAKLGMVAGTLTMGHVIGTPGYMAPEQATVGAIDHRADVFSLAAMTYRALTGRPPFGGDDLPKVLFATVYSQPVRPGELVELEEDVDLVLALGLAKDPDLRPATAATFAGALGAAVRGELDDALRARARALLAESPFRR